MRESAMFTLCSSNTADIAATIPGRSRPTTETAKGRIRLRPSSLGSKRSPRLAVHTLDLNFEDGRLVCLIGSIGGYAATAISAGTGPISSGRPGRGDVGAA